jgi:hypothetical protein
VHLAQGLIQAAGAAPLDHRDAGRAQVVQVVGTLEQAKAPGQLRGANLAVFDDGGDRREFGQAEDPAGDGRERVDHDQSQATIAQAEGDVEGAVGDAGGEHDDDRGVADLGEVVIDALQREFYQLRCEVDELRAEVLAAREDFRRQSSQSAASTQTGSPLYNDAMQMAIQGHDATTIAHRCGIARAEADLVVSLARNRQEGF